MDAIHLIRTHSPGNLPVTIFSDAEEGELEEILRLPQVRLAEDKADILDILLMSQSKILVLSQSSTFSYWAAFLSDALVIMNNDDWQEKIKDASETYREYRWTGDDASKIDLGKLLEQIELT